MGCSRFTDDVLAEYLAGELEKEAAAELVAHLARCGPCRARTEALRKLLLEARAGGEWSEVDLGVRDSVLARIRAEAPTAVSVDRPACAGGRGTRRRVSPSRRRPISVGWSWAVGLTVAAAAAVVLVVWGAGPAREATHYDGRIAEGPSGKAPAPAEPRRAWPHSTQPAPGIAREETPEGPAPVEPAPGRPAEPPAVVEVPSPEPSPSVPATAEAPQPGGSLAYFAATEGEVEYARAGKDRWFAAKEGANLLAGDSVRTRFSRARVVFESGSVLYVNRFTTLTLGEKAGPPGLSMVGGEVYVETVPEDKGFWVETPHGRAVDLATKFGVDVELNGTLVVVAEGKVEASTDEGTAQVATGQEVRLARRTSPPEPVREARGLDRRLAWAGAVSPEAEAVLLKEDFEDEAAVPARWLPIRNGFPTRCIGRLEIELTPGTGDASPGGWHVPGGLRTAAAFEMPFRVSADVEVTHRHADLVAALAFIPKSSTASGGVDAVYGDKGAFHVRVRGAEYALKVENRMVRSVRRADGGGRERWTVEVDRETVRLLVDGSEVFRAPHGLEVGEAHRIGLESTVKETVPAGSLVRFDNLVVEQLRRQARKGR